MGEFLFGVELPTLAPSGTSGLSLTRYDLAHAKEEIDALDTHTVPAGEQYIVVDTLTLSGSLVLNGTLVIL